MLFRFSPPVLSNQHANQLSNKPTNEPTNQPTNNPSTNPPTNLPPRQQSSQPTNPLINKPTNPENLILGASFLGFNCHFWFGLAYCLVLVRIVFFIEEKTPNLWIKCAELKPRKQRNKIAKNRLHVVCVKGKNNQTGEKKMCDELQLQMRRKSIPRCASPQMASEIPFFPFFSFALWISYFGTF